jgi:sugar phosphate isomerase/epimerase
MPIAVHSISWGRESNIETISTEARAAGFDGVEIFQHPYRTLGGPKRVHDALSRSNLTLVGVCGGSFSERCTFVEEYMERGKGGNSHIPYVYVDEWREPDCSNALESGFQLALHPHMFKTVQTMAEAERLLNQFPRLKLLPDTAHLTIAGDNPVSAILNHTHQLAAIHLKDWKRDVGRSYQFYARGFCGLGQGDIDFSRILASCHRFTGWLVIEQDFALSAMESAKRSYDWLVSNMPTRST